MKIINDKKTLPKCLNAGVAKLPTVDTCMSLTNYTTILPQGIRYLGLCWIFSIHRSRTLNTGREIFSGQKPFSVDLERNRRLGGDQEERVSVKVVYKVFFVKLDPVNPKP